MDARTHISTVLHNNTVPVVVHKSYEQRVEGIQVSDQYGELIHDEELCLRHLTSPFSPALLLIHQNHCSFLQNTGTDWCSLTQRQSVCSVFQYKYPTEV